MKKIINKLQLLATVVFLVWLSTGSIAMAQEKLIRSLNNTNSLAIINPSLVDTIWFVEGANESADGTAGFYRWIPDNTTTADNRISFTSRFTGAPAGRFISIVPNLWMFNTGQFTATTNQINLATSLSATNILLGLGTAAGPSLSFIGDTNTGIYSTGANTIGISTDGALRWTIGATGILQSDLAQTIQSGTGNLTLATAAGNGNIVISPNGSGVISADSLIRITAETDSVLNFVDTTDGNAGYVSVANNIITGGTIDNIGITGVSGIEFSANDGVSVQAKLTGSTGNLSVSDNGGLIIGDVSQYTLDSNTPELQILGTGIADSSQLQGQWSNNADGAFHYFFKSRGATVGSNAIVQSGDGLGNIRWNANDGVDGNSIAAQISAEVDGAPGVADMPGRIRFLTTADGAASPTEALRINSSQSIVLSSGAELAYTPSGLQTLAAGSAIVANATRLRVAGSGGAVTITATPTIADGANDGQIIYLFGTSDANSVTVQDNGTLVGSNLELGAATRLLGNGDILVLMFDSTNSLWYEVSFANN